MTMNNDNLTLDQAKTEIESLTKKIQVMRALLWEWNSSSDSVWEYWRLKEVGETAKDYEFLLD
jgi:hypothetical protein